MALSAKLEFRQSQALVMTPQLMQAIKLLQLSNIDLVSYVEEELECNPLLERGEAGDMDTVGGDGAAAQSADDTAEQIDGDADWVDTSLSSTGGDIEAVLDTGLANVFPDEVPAKALDPDQLAGSSWSATGNGGAAPGDERNLEAVHAADISLADYLSEQLGLAVEDPATRLIGRYLIDCLDEAGYLRADIADVAKHAPVAKIMRQRVIESPDKPRRILATIADEYAAPIG